MKKLSELIVFKLMAQDPASNDTKSDTFSLEDLDQILEAEDPGFNESLNAIKKEGVQDASSIEAFSIESKDDPSGFDATDEDDEALTFREKVRKKGLVAGRWVRDFVLARVRTARNRVVLAKTAFIGLFQHTLPDYLRYQKSRFAENMKRVGDSYATFAARPRKEKLAVVCIGFCAVAVVYVLFRAATSSLLPRLGDDLLKTYATAGEVVGTFSKDSDYIPLFQAFPEIEFQVRLEKVTVNLRPDPRSGRLPMGLFEFYLGVDSRDTAVEIRDREKELLDLLQRTIEGFTYSEVMSRAGKARLKSRIRDNFNAVLNQGRVMNVYLNRIVTTH